MKSKRQFYLLLDLLAKDVKKRINLLLECRKCIGLDREYTISW